METHALNQPSWAIIRDEALRIVRLTQRADGLWTLPTAPAEAAHTHAEPGSADDVARQTGFGYGSPTFTYTALEALARAGRGVPLSVPSTALLGIAALRVPNGGYGAFAAGKDHPTPSPTPRHTAVAILVRLRYDAATPDEAHLNELYASVEWLLGTQLAKGGWAFRPGPRNGPVGYLSTASAIAALSLFLTQWRARRPALSRRCATAIRKAFLQLLLVASPRGAWSGDAIPPPVQFRNVAFAYRLLWQALEHDDLETWLPGARAILLSKTREFLGLRADWGWPDCEGSAEVGIASTCWVLQLLDHAPEAREQLGDVAREVEMRLLLEWQAGQLQAAMQSWDWHCLLGVSSLRSEPLGGRQARVLEQEFERIRRSARAGRLRRTHLRDFHHATRRQLEHALTAGQGFRPAWLGFVQTGARQFSATVVNNFGWSLLVALFFMLMAWLINDEAPSAYLRRFFGAG